MSSIPPGAPAVVAAAALVLVDVGACGSELDEVGAMRERASPGMWTSFRIAAVNSSLAVSLGVSDSAQIYKTTTRMMKVRVR